MKNFVKENWYKLMIGSSMMMASFGFMIYAISPSYANKDLTEKIEARTQFNDEWYFLVDSKNRVWQHWKGSNGMDWTKTGKTLE
jgi:hypothetical protein